MKLDTSVSFRPNPAAIRQLSDQSGVVGRAVRKAAEETAERARAAAPVRSGAYRDSIKVGPLVKGSNGPTCSISSASPYALSVEYLQRPVIQSALGRLTPGDFRG
jgi:hypothetical protein